jgi:hypothetical protein
MPIIPLVLCSEVNIGFSLATTQRPPKAAAGEFSPAAVALATYVACIPTACRSKRNFLKNTIGMHASLKSPHSCYKTFVLGGFHGHVPIVTPLIDFITA